MAVITLPELRQMPESKLWKELHAKRHELAQARLFVKTGREQNTSKIPALKKNIAQIHTLLTQKQRTAA
ncbi:50S ribosomal protein L29 [Candidatus Peribacteria bacterium]|nr:50S ribosomal protein L29 [Candidatus Peribacteria bacterium]